MLDATKQIDWKEKLKDKKCCLCGKLTEEEIHFYVGGYLNYAHESCAEIGSKAIENYLHWQSQRLKLQTKMLPKPSQKTENSKQGESD